MGNCASWLMIFAPLSKLLSPVGFGRTLIIAGRNLISERSFYHLSVIITRRSNAHASDPRRFQVVTNVVENVSISIAPCCFDKDHAFETTLIDRVSRKMLILPLPCSLPLFTGPLKIWISGWKPSCYWHNWLLIDVKGLDVIT